MSKILKVTAVIYSLLLLQGCATHSAGAPYDGGKWLQPVLDRNITLIQSYIDNGEHLTYQDTYGLTPLHTAVTNGDVRIVKLLIDAGANVHAETEVFGSPLGYAAMSPLDRTEIINLLLAHNADIHQRDSHGFTPLGHAYRNPNNVRALLRGGANPLDNQNSGISIKKHYQQKRAYFKAHHTFQKEIFESLSILDEFIPVQVSLNHCDGLPLKNKSTCYQAHIKQYPNSVTSNAVKNEMALMAQTEKEKTAKARLERARLTKAKKKQAKALQKLMTQQACRLKSSGWVYLSKSCKQGLADGQGEAINGAKNLKFVGLFKLGHRTQGELYANNQLMYDGSLKNDRPHGTGTCMHEGEPEECKFYKGKRTDVLYKQRLEFVKQRELMANSEARINKSLESSEQRMDERLTQMESHSQSGRAQRNEGNSASDYAVSALKKKATDKVVDALFDSLF
jgi:hypothetical protein